MCQDEALYTVKIYDIRHASRRESRHSAWKDQHVQGFNAHGLNKYDKLASYSRIIPTYQERQWSRPMSETQAPIETGKLISITPNAALRVQKLLDERQLEGHALRVYVSGGGCSGLQYGMAFDPEPRSDDLTFSHDSIEVVIDPVSYGYLAGSTIDYVDDLMGGGFNIQNPNAVSSCGCGQSFRTEASKSAVDSTASGGCGCH